MTDHMDSLGNDSDDEKAAAAAAEEEAEKPRVVAPPPMSQKQAAPMPVMIGGSRTYKLPSVKSGLGAENSRAALDEVMMGTTDQQVSKYAHRKM